MFLVAVTKSDISDKFSSEKCETFRFQKKYLTMVYENFLSQIDSQNELCVFESPLISHSNAKEIVLSQVRINLEKDIIEISRPSVSGRSIYYHIDSKGDFFCSTHISKLRQAGVIIRENKAVLPEFFVFRYVMPPQTLYENIYQLSEDSRLNVKSHDGKYKLETTNNFNPYSSKNLNEFKDFRERVSDLISKSIEPLGVCKDRLAILLSGGLDSSLLLKICQDKEFNINETHSTGYPFETFEKEYAESSADYFEIGHKYHEISLDQYLPGLIEAISAAEQPLPHMQSVLIYLLLKDGLPKNRDIVLNGQGTELNCNRTNFLIHQFNNKSSKIQILKLMGKFPITSSWRGSRWALNFQSRIDCGIEDPNSILWEQDPIGSLSWASNYFHVKKGDIIRKPLDLLKSFGEHSFYETTAIYDFLGANHATESVWCMLGENQKKIVYYPFSNLALTNYLFSIPDGINYKKYKYVFKEVARHCGVPDFIVNRRKLGFNPLTNLDLLKEKVFEPLIPIASKVFDEQQVRNVNPENWGYNFWTLWNILNYSIWKRLWVNNEPKEILLQELAKD